MTRILLVELGAGALPAPNPLTPAAATWAPAVYVQPPVPVPGSFAATALVDGVLLSWAAVAGDGVVYAVERAPDSNNAPGAWSEVARVTALQYPSSVANGVVQWWRVRAVRYGRASAFTTALKATAVSGSTLRADATTALAQLTDIASDSLLTPVEKPTTVRERDVIVAEQAGIDAQAASYGIGAERTNYNNAVKALTDYLATLTTPAAWDNFGGNTDIVGATFRQKFAEVYTTRQKLLDAIVAKAKAIADSKVQTFYIDAGESKPLGQTVGDICIDRSTGEQFRWSGTEWVLTGKHMSGVYGANLIPNPRFSEAAFGVADLTKVTSANVQIVDNWFMRQVGNHALGAELYAQRLSTGVRSFVGKVTLANGQYAAAQFASLNKIAVEASTSYVFGFERTPAYNGTLPSGVGAESRMVIQWFRADDSVSFTDVVALPRSTTTTVKNEFKSPSDAVWARIYCDSYVVNNSGVTWTHDNTVALYTDFKSVWMTRKLDLDGYIDDGSIYGRPRRSILQNGIVVGRTYGANLVPNGSFATNLCQASSSWLSMWEDALDDWYYYDGSFTTGLRETSGNRYLLLLRSDPAKIIPAGQGWVHGSFRTKSHFAVTESRKYRVKASGSAARNATPPAGVEHIQRVYIEWYKSDGTFITQSYNDQNAIGSKKWDFEVTAPAEASKATILLLLYVRNTATTAADPAGALWYDARWSWVSMHLVNDMDTEIGDGSIYGRFGLDDGFMVGGVRRQGLRFGTSGHRLGDERNMRALAGWNKTNGAAQLSMSSSDAGSTATISIPAHTRVAGFGNTSFPSGSITGLAFSTYYLVYRDTPNYNPSENAYVATTDSFAGLKHSDRVVVGGITTVADGGTSSGGGGFNDCVAGDAWVRAGLQARDVRRFTLLDVLRPKRWYWRVLWHVLGRRLPARWTPRLVEQPGVLVETESGAQLPCSHSTPFDLPDGRVAYAPYLLGELVHTDSGVERVVGVTDLGRVLVARISVYGHSFAAGRHPARRIFSHNATVKP